MKIGVIGNGFVGKATCQLKCKDIELLAYDVKAELCNPPGTTLHDLMYCDFIFVSVPTPMNTDGSCYLKIVNQVIEQINLNDYKGFIVLRSTVPVGTSDSLKCYFMPEFLTEKNFINDFISNPNWIFGLKNCDEDVNFKKKITKLFSLAKENGRILNDQVTFLTNSEAEMVKLYRNTFLATKVAFCNEIYRFCCVKNVNYENVRKVAVLDPRIGQSHSSVPGHDGKTGFGGTCFPKDMNSLLYEMESSNSPSFVIKAAVCRNQIVDRPEQDWKHDKGRATI
jgi:UDPglucose 6-dehydrogenase